MRSLGLPIALVLLVASPAPARAAGEIYTLGGTGTGGAVREGGAASRAGLGTDANVAALPGGGFLVGDFDAVLRVDAQGRIRTVAGSGRRGPAGDGGPALKASFSIEGLAALPSGGFLVSDFDHRRIRMIDPRGSITTVAGGGTSNATHGIAATRAQLADPSDVAALPGGGFVFIDYGDPEVEDDTEGVAGPTVRRVGPDGRIGIVAGNGENDDAIPALEGQPATSVALTPSDVAVAQDGSILIAEYYAGRVDRVAPDGAITVAASGTSEAPLKPSSIAATADGGFLIVDNGVGSFSARARVLRVGPDGAMTTIAGTGRFLPNAPTGFEHRGDGAGALTADLHHVSDVDSLPDGGALLAEGGLSQTRERVGSLVRYVAPPAPRVLAAALDRDHDRVIGRGRPAAVNVSTTLPATVTLTLDGRSTRAQVGAGTTRIALPAPPAGTRPHTVALVAADRAGRSAGDRMRLYPTGWLSDEAGRLVAVGIAATVLHGAVPGDGVARCRRFGPARVDCAMGRSSKECTVVASVSEAGGRLRWGTYACGMRAHPRYRRRPRALQPRDWTCKKTDTACPPAWFGKLDETALVPSS